MPGISFNKIAEKIAFQVLMLVASLTSPGWLLLRNKLQAMNDTFSTSDPTTWPALFLQVSQMDNQQLLGGLLPVLLTSLALSLLYGMACLKLAQFAMRRALKSIRSRTGQAA